MPQTAPPPQLRPIKAEPSFSGQTVPVFHPEDEQTLHEMLMLLDPATVPYALKHRINYPDTYSDRPFQAFEQRALMELGLLQGFELHVAEDLPAIFGVLEAYRSQLHFYRYVASVLIGILQEWDPPYGAHPGQRTEAVKDKLKARLENDIQALPANQHTSILQEVAGILGHRKKGVSLKPPVAAKSAD